MDELNSGVNQNFVVKKNINKVGIFRGKQPHLSHLDIELTERCNNACIHCYINLPEKDSLAKAKELTADAWKDILRQAADLGALSVRLTGGEPLLREDFAEIYLYARRLGMKVFLFTNGRLITPELADLFVKIPPLKPIEISVYGMHAKSYDAVARAPGAFDQFRRGMDLLTERQIPFVVKFVVLPPNRHELAAFDTWSASLPGMKEPPHLYSFDLRTRRDSQIKNRIIRQCRFSPDEVVAFLAQHEAAYRKSMAQFAEKFLYVQGDLLFDCGAGVSGCVDAYGKYQMCMLLRHPDTVYDLTKGTIVEALTQVFPRLKELRATNPDYLKRCARCFIKGFCEQCPAKSWSEHGTLDTPVEYLCQVAHAQARFLGLLKDGESSWEVRDWQARIEKFVRETELLDASGDGGIKPSGCKEGG
jgi:radical SAM protein with 4Fe4S-binding SPASM domain